MLARLDCHPGVIHVTVYETGDVENINLCVQAQCFVRIVGPRDAKFLREILGAFERTGGNGYHALLSVFRKAVYEESRYFTRGHNSPAQPGNRVGIYQSGGWDCRS
jgi:hypothetical protein